MKLDTNTDPAIANELKKHNLWYPNLPTKKLVIIIATADV
jgi:hypothetical protein